MRSNHRSIGKAQWPCRTPVPVLRRSQEGVAPILVAPPQGDNPPSHPCPSSYSASCKPSSDSLRASHRDTGVPGVMRLTGRDSPSAGRERFTESTARSISHAMANRTLRGARPGAAGRPHPSPMLTRSPPAQQPGLCRRSARRSTRTPSPGSTPPRESRSC